MSHHLDTPLAGQNGQLYIDDLYVFPADGSTLFVMDVNAIADSFHIDLSLLGIINAAVRNGTAADLSAWRPENAKNSFANTTVESIVLEVSHQHPQLRPGARTGARCTTKLATDSGGWRQINRAGHPMMWPIFWPDDTDFSNPANTRHPAKTSTPTANTSPSKSPASCQPAGPPMTPRATLRPWPGNCSPTCCPT